MAIYYGLWQLWYIVSGYVVAIEEGYSDYIVHNYSNLTGL